MDVINTILISIATSLAGAFAGWLFGRRRQRIEEIDAATDTWQKIVDSLKLQIEHLLVARESDSKKIDEMTIQITELRSEVEILRNRLRSKEYLEKKVKRYEKLLDDNNIAY